MPPRVQPTLGDPFQRLFRPDCADLIYGLSQGGRDYREEYLQTLGGQLPETVKRDTYYTIDQFNNNLGLFSAEDHFAKMDERVKASVTAEVRGEKREVVTPAQRRFYASTRNSRFDPTQVFKDTREMRFRLEKEGYDPESPFFPEERKAEIALAMSRQYKMVRMACKNGLLHFARNYAIKHRSVVHFILDGIDTDAVANKVKQKGHLGRDATPISFSELRMCYRNWDSFSQCVWFYRNKEYCVPPWVENRALWETYQRKREDKLLLLRTAVQNAINEYHGERRRSYFTRQSRESKKTLELLGLLLKNDPDLTTLKHYVRFLLRYIDTPPPITEYCATAMPLKEQSRLQRLLEDHYMAWCHGAAEPLATS